MLDLQDVRTGSLRLLLAVSVALAGQSQYALAIDQDLSNVSGVQSHSVYGAGDWSWLPAYKRESLSPDPYTTGSRIWGAVSGEMVPLAAVFLVHYLAKNVGLLHQTLTGTNGEQAADYAWRLGEAVGDLATTNTPGGWLWRLCASNVDLLPATGAIHLDRRLLWLLRRTLAYAPLLGRTVPDALRQHALGAVGVANIAFDPAELNQHFKLTFVSASASDGPGAPGSAFLDLDFMRRPDPPDGMKGRFERALAGLDALSREEDITRIRFYPRILREPGKEAELALFVRPYFAGRPGLLVLFPGSFGLEKDRRWWTDAVDLGLFQGVYNDDQYMAVKLTNQLMGYRKELVTPLSDQIMELLPSALESAIDLEGTYSYGEQNVLSGHAEPFEKQIQNARTVFAERTAIESPENGGVVGTPLQSMHHSVVAMGQQEGVLFVDDWLSQRAELPVFTVKSRIRYSEIRPEAVLNLENHLPSPPARGSKQIAVTLARGQAYSWLVSHLLQTRMQELKSHRESLQKYHPLLAQDKAALNELAAREARLTQGRSLQESLNAQQQKVAEEHSGDLGEYRTAQIAVNAAKAEQERLSTRLQALDHELAQASAAKAELGAAYHQIYNTLPVPNRAQLDEARTALAEMEDVTLPEKRRLFQRSTRDYTGASKEGANALWRFHEREADVIKMQKTRAIMAENFTESQKALVERKDVLVSRLRSNAELARLVQLEQLRKLSPETATEEAQLGQAEVQHSLNTLREAAAGGPVWETVNHATGSAREFATTAWHTLSAAGSQIRKGTQAVLPAAVRSRLSAAPAAEFPAPAPPRSDQIVSSDRGVRQDATVAEPSETPALLPSAPSAPSAPTVPSDPSAASVASVASDASDGLQRGADQGATGKSVQGTDIERVTGSTAGSAVVAAVAAVAAAPAAVKPVSSRHGHGDASGSAGAEQPVVPASPLPEAEAGGRGQLKVVRDQASQASPEGTLHVKAIVRFESSEPASQPSVRRVGGASGRVGSAGVSRATSTPEAPPSSLRETASARESVAARTNLPHTRASREGSDASSDYSE